MSESSGKQPSQPILLCAQPDRGLTTIANQALQDSRISFAAKGVLATCLSSKHQFNKEWVISCSTDSPAFVSGAFRELFHFGYIQAFQQGELMCYRVTDAPEDEGSPVEDAPADPTPEPPPAAPARRPRSRSAASAQLELEDWLEPHRQALERWMAQRMKAYPKLPREITTRSLTALQYAKELNVLQDFCELASESCWQSLGFNGYKSYIDKIVQEKQPGKPARPPMSAINYTLK
jgi:hypothetical protein